MYFRDNITILNFESYFSKGILNCSSSIANGLIK